MKPIPSLLLIAVFVCVAAGLLRAQEYSPEGLTGHLAVSVNGGLPKEEFTYGVSFYSSVYPLNPSPTLGVQLGWGTWVIPDNLTFPLPLCPEWTFAYKNWPEQSPWHHLFQTIEGGMGQWGNTHFPSSLPKFRVNAVPDCYTHQIGGPAWNFGGDVPLAMDKLGLAQLSNTLLLPPDGIPFTNVTNSSVVGRGWIALPLIPAYTSPAGVPTGDQNWTLFFRAANFSGPVAFFVPEVWSAISVGYPTHYGRGHDARPGFINNIALEVGNLPMFTGQDQTGVRYRRVPRLTFDADSSGRAVLEQDVKLYSKQAIWNAVSAWIANGTVPAQFDPAGIFTAPLQGSGAPFELGGQPIAFDSSFYAGVVQTSAGTDAFGMQWSGPLEPGAFPEYFKEESGSWKPVPAGEVPSETNLAQQTFTPAPYQNLPALDVSPASPWSSTSWVAGPFTANLTDGSSVDYVWYRFIDQPAIARLGLTEEVRQRLQTFVESLHEHSGLNGITIAPPSSGSLASIDSAQFVVPPPGREKGYVPIVIRQYRAVSTDEVAVLTALYNSTNGDNWSNSANWFSGPVDTWHGVTVDNGHVVEIDLLNNNLTGTLPTELGNLTALRRLELSQNHISGPIPSQVGNLTNLGFFSAYNNDLTGSIPSAIGNLTKLELLQLGANQLTGSLPPSVGNLSTLHHLLLADNQLSGAVPSAIGALIGLQTLELNINAFSGPLPSSLTNLTAVQKFHFDGTNVCIPVNAALQQWLAGIPNLSTTTLTCASGTIKITAQVKAKGIDAAGVHYVDVEFSNRRGTGSAVDAAITTLTFRTSAGTGTVTSAGTLPVLLNTIGPGDAKTVRLSMNVPSTVTKFGITERGEFSDVNGSTFTFIFTQVVIP